MATRFKGEFIGFSFNGVHCSDLGITRVSAGDRYTVGLFADITDQTQTVAGKIGEYYYGTQIGSKPISLDFAFDSVTDFQLAQLSAWLSGETLGKLVFDEFPYKYYMAKVSSNSSVSYLPFEEYEYGSAINIYRGEGSIQFVAFNPLGYADNIKLNTYTDATGAQYNLANRPTWLFSSQILPDMAYNKTGAITPVTSNLFYVGGMFEAPIDLEIRFNSAATNASNVQNSIATLNTSVSNTGTQITNLQNQRQTYKQQVDSLNSQRQAQVNIVITNLDKLEKNKAAINVSMGKILTYNDQITAYDNQVASLNTKLTKGQNDLATLNNKLTLLNTTMTGLMQLTNPGVDKQQQIANVQNNIDNTIAAISAQEATNRGYRDQIADINYYKVNTNNLKAVEERELERLKQEQITINGAINSANIRIADLDRQLEIPTKKVYELDVQITELTGKKNTLTNQIQALNTSGLALTGNVVTFSRPALSYNGKTYPAKSFTIQIEDVLRSRTLHVKASNHEVAYYDASGNRYEYYNNFLGDFLTAVPTGFSMMKRGIFTAGSSLVNTIEMETNLTASEKSYIMGKNIIFKEDYRNTHQVSQVINIRTKAGTNKDELVLSNGYSLTNGTRSFIVLNNLMSINVSDTRFIQSINFKFPYVYY